MDTFLWTFQVIAEHGRSLTGCKFYCWKSFLDVSLDNFTTAQTLLRLEEKKKTFCNSVNSKKRFQVDECSLCFDALLIYWSGELVSKRHNALCETK